MVTDGVDKKVKEYGGHGASLSKFLYAVGCKEGEAVDDGEVMGAGVQVLDEVDDGLRYVVVGEYLPLRQTPGR